MITARRDVLLGLTATALAALRAGAARASAGALWLSCRTDPATGHEVAGFDGSGSVRFSAALPARGHAVTAHPLRDEAVVFARRPGSFAVVFAPEQGVVIRRFDTPPDRHFQGHGAYDPTGRVLIATENDKRDSNGVLGLYDAADGYRRIGELPSFGIDPHQVLLLDDGRTLAIANGGIITGGRDGREKLNVATMAPSLAYVELASGKLALERRLPRHLHQLSIRHLAAAGDGTLAIAMQWEGPAEAEVPLVGIEDGSGIALLPIPSELVAAMAHYIGSVAVDPSGRTIAASCPRGGVVTFWDVRERRFAGSVPMADGCGIAPYLDADRFVLSAGTGRTATAGPELHPADLPGGRGGVAWDNHLTRRLAEPASSTLEAPSP